MVNVIGILVAFIPTGLPVAVTLSLLLMARKMAKHKVLVKNLTTIETLSSVNVIASDKTGTLTQNKMFVSSAAAGLDVFDMRNMDKLERIDSFKHLVATAFLCNNASFTDDKENENLQVSLKKGKLRLRFLIILLYKSYKLLKKKIKIS
jgi:sodium/potassium-transporting ATPase subunit alpha